MNYKEKAKSLLRQRMRANNGIHTIEGRPDMTVLQYLEEMETAGEVERLSTKPGVWSFRLK